MTPRDIAIRQLEAYNNHDLTAFCDLFVADAVLIDMPTSNVIASGIDEIRAIYKDRFSIAGLYCNVHATTDIGNFAIDRETVYGLPDGPLNVVAMYEVVDNKIQRVFFIRETA
ncbi:MAG: SnoaL-like domain-containing protein [Enterobacterales bacterium]|nr:SnoaL-like domain-containing protein [Enterobacterales bacterium]